MRDEPAGAPGIRVLVVAAYPALRAGLRSMVERSGLSVTGEAGPAALDTVLLQSADVVLADLGEEPDSILDALDAAPQVPAVLLARAVDDYSDAPEGTARGWLLREATAEQISSAIVAVANGLAVLEPVFGSAATASEETPEDGPVQNDEALTRRETEVLRLMAAGLTNRGIAVELGISEHTVKYHVAAILSKTGAAGRTEAVMLAFRRGLLAL